MSRHRLTSALVVAALASLVVSSLGVAALPVAGGAHPAPAAITSSVTAAAPDLPAAISPATGPWEALPEPELEASAGATPLGPAPASTQVQVLITLGFADPSRLDALLTGLSQPSSPLYHEYLTQAEFDQEFGSPSGPYASLTQYVETHGAVHVQTYADRASLSFDASSAGVQAIFHTTLDTFLAGGDLYVAPTSPAELPASVASHVVEVQGLSTDPLLQAHAGPGGAIPELARVEVRPSPTPAIGSSYLPPAIYNGVQLEYAPDFQVAYDEQSLFTQEGYPTNEVVATILWAGQYTGAPISTPYGPLTTDEYLGPFDAGDISTFYNETVPTNEPHAIYQAVPLSGAPEPSRLASWDSVGATFENTLDLEMVGSTAPGAHIYNVYGNTSTFVQLDADFAYILNPTNTPALDDVQVISNSWYGTDHNDTGWYQDLEEAQARGITVLACSGDSGDNTASSKYFGSEAAYPGTMAYNAFGTTSVGGSDVLLDGGLTVENQTVWNISSKDTSDGGPAGSEGGISTVVSEPSWQRNTEANSVILGAGRGVPDIAAEANNTLLTYSIDGDRYEATNASSTGEFYWAWGTSIATPLTAGMVAEIDHVLGQQHQGAVGFLNPDLYALANQQSTSPIYNATLGYYADGGYNSSLAVNVTLPVDYGRDLVYKAFPGYNLVAGWGTLDAYNFTVMILRDNSTGVPGRLWGVMNNMTLTGIAGTSATGYLASVQQNFFLADSLGAPIYWVQNVIYVVKSGSSLELNYTGWLVYPFYGQYFTQAGYEYAWPVSGHVLTPPLTWNVYTRLLPGAGLDGQLVQFNVGPYSVTLPAPGAAYIIGSLWYNYSWRGQTFENGPFSPNPVPGGLGPECGLVGGPSGGNTSYTAATKGTINAMILPYGVSAWQVPDTSIVWPAITQTGESSYNLAYTSTGQNTWSMGYSAKSMDQGILSYAPPEYQENFTETGLPTGAPWYVNLTNGQTFASTTNEVSVWEPTGSYTFGVAAGPAGWTASPASGTFTQPGATNPIPVLFTSATAKLVNFTASGLPATTAWSVLFNGVEHSSTSSTTPIVIATTVGSYPYFVEPVPGYVRSPFEGTLSVSAPETWVNVTFSVPDYAVEFNVLSSPAPSDWWVNVTGGPSTIATGTSATISLPNGTYPFTTAAGSAWVPSTPTGSFTVDGQSLTIGISFTSRTYAVTFQPTGTGPATYFVNLTGQPSRSSPFSTALSVQEPNGSYPFALAASDPTWQPTFALGTVTVHGQDVTVDIAFRPFELTVSFTESGLPSGDTWSVDLGALGTLTGSGSSGSSDTLSVQAVNGSYAYTVTGPQGYTVSRSSGTVSVDGIARAVTLFFNATSTGGGSTSQGGFLGLGDLGYLLVLAIVVVAIVALAVALGRRRKSAPSPAAPPAGGYAAYPAPYPGSYPPSEPPMYAPPPSPPPI